MRLLLFFLIFFSISLGFAQNSITESYINNYQHIAIAEMHRTGIPASITLAQGLLESNWGKSDLAVRSKNHFGIKCGNDWSGKGHYKFDDEFSNSGQKKKSCFRVYETAEDSFYDHSSFLTDKKKAHRYGFLFNYASDDYQSWAEGLSKAGYATDPQYAKKLISIIKKNELHRFDAEPDKFLLASSDNDVSYKLVYINSVKAVVARGGETAKELAKKMGVSRRTILNNNESIKKSSQILSKDEYVFLEKKKAYFIGDESFHVTKKGERIGQIAHKYGIDIAYLKALNKMGKHTSLHTGQVVWLKQKEVRSNPEYGINEKLIAEANPVKGDYLFERALTPLDD